MEDAGRHAALAGLAKSYLAYCDCVRGAEKLTIAAAFTDGDADNLMVGRNGVFYDRQGRDWDATITKVIENPISIRQAKKSLNMATQIDVRNGYLFELEAYNRMVPTEDRLEGIRAFNEKRKPVYKGK